MNKWKAVLCAAVLTGCTTVHQATTKTEMADSFGLSENSEISDVSKQAPISVQPEEADATVWKFGANLDRILPDEDDIDIRAVVRILTIDGCSNYWEEGEVYAGAYTYGTFEVLKAYKGDVREGGVYGYAIAGGTIPYEDYAKSLAPEILEKQIRVAEENGMSIPEEVTTVIHKTPITEDGVYYVVTTGEMRIHGMLNLILPYPETFMAVDEDTLDSEDIMAFNTDLNEWWNVKNETYPDR